MITSTTRTSTTITSWLTAETPSPGSTTGSAASSGPGIEGSGLGLLLAVVALLVIALVVTPWILSVVKDSKNEPVFMAPYMTWFVLHYSVAIVGMLVVVALAVTKVLNETGVSALLGSLFGYVLGTAKSDRGTSVGATSGSGSSGSSVRPTVTKIEPPSEAAGKSVTLTGTGFSTKETVTVTLAGLPATNVKVTSPTTITADAPSGTPTGTAVTVGFADGLSVTPSGVTFTRS